MRRLDCTAHCIFLLFGSLQPVRFRLSQNCIFQSNCMRIEFTALHFHWPFSPRGAIKVVYKGKEVFLVLFSARPGQNEGEMAAISHWEPFILLRLSFACSQAPTKMFSMTQESFNGVGKTLYFCSMLWHHIAQRRYYLRSFEGPQKWSGASW